MRTIVTGTKRSEIKNQKEYYYNEALQLLGPCTRKTKKVWEQQQEWHFSRSVTDTYWEGGYSYTYDSILPAGWYNVGEKKLIEKYDVWQNGKGDFLLATPL